MSDKKPLPKTKAAKNRLIAATGKRFKAIRQNRQSAPHKSFRLTKKYKIAATLPRLDSSRSLLKSSLQFYLQNWKIFAILGLVYLLFLWAITGLPNQQTYNDLKNVVDDTLQGDTKSWLGIGTLLLGTLSGALTPDQSELQQFLSLLLSIVFWLVFIWTARHIMAGQQVTVRQALYNASAPLIPILVILFIIALQLIPAAIGGLVLSYTFGTETAIVDGLEAMLLSIGALLLMVLSLYWLLQSLLALIIVTLPNMYPLQAMASARGLAAGRRLAVLWRVAMFAFVILVLWVAVLLPVITLGSYVSFGWLPVVPLVINILAAVTLPVSIIYLYQLYRKLL